MNTDFPPCPAPNSDDCEAALLAALSCPAPMPPADAALVQRVRERVLALVAQDDRHLTVPAADERWQPFGDGVQIKVLHESDGVMWYLLKLAPAAVIAAHRHPIDEECIVLDGTVRIGDTLEVGAGGFHFARAGSVHLPITSDHGALLYLRGAVPDVSQLI